MAARAVVLAALLALAAPDAVPAGEPDPLAPSYEADLRGADGGFRWSGRMAIAVGNPDAAPLKRIWIRLWGNGLGGCRRPAVRIGSVEGADAGTPSVRCTAVPLDLAQPLARGARATVSFDVDIRVPRVHDRFGTGAPGLALLSNALPALAHREAGRWRLDRYFGGGEAWTYPAADWRVRLAAPPAVDVAAPGVLQPDGYRLLARGRDYSWAAGRMRSLRAAVAGVDVTVWAARAARAAVLHHALRRVERRLPQLERLFGPYGWPDLQVVVGDLSGAQDVDVIGMEHTALIMTEPTDLVITHELAHEWWYALIGDDQARAPWLDEAFATWSEWALRGTPFPCRLLGELPRYLTRSVDYYRNRPFLYGAAVYVGGACLLARLERRMGRRTFRAALRAYALDRRYGWHTATSFVAAMDAAAPRRLDDLWRRYRLLWRRRAALR